MLLTLRDIRKKKGFTQQELAAAVGATKRQIGAWERGENDLPMDYAVAIADILGCTVDAIAGRKSETYLPKFPLTACEYELIAIFNKLDERDKKRLLTFARTMLD